MSVDKKYFRRIDWLVPNRYDLIGLFRDRPDS
jgi:hypothetical protein